MMTSYCKTFIRPHENDPFWISIDITQKSFRHSKTNLKSLMVISAYFKHVRVFIPIFFALLEDDQTPEGLGKSLLKFRTEILENFSLVPT